MAERGVDVIKALMRMGVMATMNDVVDPDTAELIVTEFGHTSKRASEAAVEIGLRGEADADDAKTPRPAVVTVMGHVDHGKTSLLDALRSTDVASHEAGGITQHIGAYQVKLASGEKITFIDTPGHEAFTEMRARGATVTDIVILVVAADDGIMPQTIEAIQHAKAAEVPIVVAINKVDKPDADPARVRTELLQHGLVVEELGGDILSVEVSAKTRQGLDKLQEALLLQAEILDLRANPDRAAEGVIIEAKLDRGRGPVATVLVQRGTLRVGDIFVAGGEWGRVRALVDERGEHVKEAGPSMPIEILGLQGTPYAGDELSVVDTEARAREVVDFRQRRKRDQNAKAAGRGTVEQMLSKIAAGEARELPVVVKSDVQGSLEAILASLNKMSTDEVATRILYAGVGGISESDVTLAHASNALIIAFNVRANAQARELARRDNVDIRYYSVIYNVVDDVKAALSGMLSPSVRENFLGYAEIREVFDITKVGKVGGCMVTEGVVKRGSKVRLLRDNVVIHEGSLKTLKRFKEEVREVKQGFECGMAFENYADIKAGDQIECFEMVEEARQL
jgi:translation initiation factor IF-2